MSFKKAVAHKARMHGVRSPRCQGQNSDLQVASYDGNEVVRLLSSHWWTNSSSSEVASRREGLEAAEWDSEAGSLHGFLDDRIEGNCNTTNTHLFERNDGNDDNSDDDNDNDEERNSDLQVASYAGNEVDRLLSSHWWTSSKVASRREGLEAAERDLEARFSHALRFPSLRSSNNPTNTHLLERNDGDNDNSDDDNDDDNDNDNDDAAFVENFGAMTST